MSNASKKDTFPVVTTLGTPAGNHEASSSHVSIAAATWHMWFQGLDWLDVYPAIICCLFYIVPRIT